MQNFKAFFFGRGASFPKTIIVHLTVQLSEICALNASGHCMQRPIGLGVHGLILILYTPEREICRQHATTTCFSLSEGYCACSIDFDVQEENSYIFNLNIWYTDKHYIVTL
jgi:hypothetical protein